MSRQVIDTTTDHGTYRGDPGKTAWDKANLNFAELYQLFQTAANKLGYFDSNGKPAFTDITEFARSLIDDGSAPAARNTLGLGPAALVAVLGSVSNTDSSAIMERGTGTYGTFFRFRNGIQICLSNQLGSNPITNPFGQLYRSTSVAWVFPAQFGGDIAPLTYAQDQSETIWCGCTQGSFTSAGITTIYPAAIGGARALFAFAIGKWY